MFNKLFIFLSISLKRAYIDHDEDDDFDILKFVTCFMSPVYCQIPQELEGHVPGASDQLHQVHLDHLQTTHQVFIANKHEK